MVSMNRATEALGPMALSVVSLAIVIGIGSVVLSELQNLSVIGTSGDTGYDTIQAGLDALATFGDFFTVIVVVGVAAVIFLLLGALRRTGGRSMA